MWACQKCQFAKKEEKKSRFIWPNCFLDSVGGRPDFFNTKKRKFLILSYLQIALKSKSEIFSFHHSLYYIQSFLKYFIFLLKSHAEQICLWLIFSVICLNDPQSTTRFMQYIFVSLSCLRYCICTVVQISSNCCLIFN